MCVTPASRPLPLESKRTTPRHGTYLLAVALSLLPAPDRVKCRDEFSGAVGKVLAAGHRRLVDGQRIGVLEYGVTAAEEKSREKMKIN